MRARASWVAAAVVVPLLLPAAPAAAQFTNLVFTPVTPCRIINTVTVGGPIAANATRSFFVTGTTGFEAQGGLAGGCGIPTNAAAVAINYVAVGPTGAGDLRAWPFGGSVPNASVVNYAAVGGLNVANGLVQPICNHATSTCTQDLSVRADVSPTFLVADVVGYFREISGTLVLNPDSGAALSTAADVDLRGRVMRGSIPFIQASTPLTLTAIGERALEANTSGHFNTAVGWGALSSNTVGSSNVAVGKSALEANVDGGFNTAVGHGALNRNVSGQFNTAIGTIALQASIGASYNTATGHAALTSTSSGQRNTATGYAALATNSSGADNTALGYAALTNNATANQNTALGGNALGSSVTGANNTAVGYGALFHLNAGSGNIALGTQAADNLTSGSNNIYIGNEGVAGENQTIRIGSGLIPHTRFFAAAVGGVNVGAGSQVFVSSTGQLGIVASSRAFKDDVRDMEGASEGLLRLRPVSFRYKEPAPSGDRPLQYGLIAEEVAEVYPELVVYSDSGQPQSVRYHLLSSMLLNELQKEHNELQAQHRLLKAQDEALQEMRARLTRLEEKWAPGAPGPGTAPEFRAGEP